MPRAPRRVAVRDILGVAETMRLCQATSRATLRRWRTRPDAPFPKPMKKLRSGELWDAAEVRAWLEANPRPEEGE